MEGPAGPTPCKLSNGLDEAHTSDRKTDRLATDVTHIDSCQSSCQCDKTQGEVKIRSKRYGRGAVESGIFIRYSLNLYNTIIKSNKVLVILTGN